MHSKDKDSQLIWEQYVTENDSGRYAGSFNRMKQEGEHAQQQQQQADREAQAWGDHAMGGDTMPGYEQAEESEGFNLDAIIAHGTGAIPGKMQPAEYFQFLKSEYEGKFSPEFFQKLEQAEAQLSPGQ